MRKFFLFIFVLCIAQSIQAQRHEIGIFAGGANVIGDVGKGTYINPFPTKAEADGKIILPIAIGGLYRFNINPFMGLRVNLTYAKVAAGDYRSSEQYKIDRNKHFNNNILEGSLVFEYNFFDINESQQTAQSPYLFFGAGIFSAKHREYDYHSKNKEIIEDHFNKQALTIPFGVGYKIRYNYTWVLSLETGVRYTKTDYIDYNVAKFTPKLMEAAKKNYALQDEINSLTYGNLSNNDWYVFTGLSLTYSFGRPACYCN